MNRPWMPLYVADYLADTGHLSAAEHGAYMLLIMHYWQNGSLPQEERRIARICRLNDAEWENSREVLSDLFDGGWRHKRIEAELERASDISNKRKAAAQHRYDTSNANAPANAELLQTQSPSQLQKKEEKPKPSVLSKKASRLSADWDLPVEWRDEAIAAGLPPERADLEGRKMLDWSLSSKNGARLDWRATWRNWFREAIDRLPKNRAPPKPLTTADVARQLRQTMDEADAGTEAEIEGGRAPPLSLPIYGNG